jgi:glycine cleavage system H protein
MTKFLEFTLDKFTFKVASDRLYSSEGVWAKAEEERILVGISDYLQQRSGDIAFAEVADAGTAVAAGEPFADLETIKADVALSCPVSGTLQAINEKLDFEPEIINQDPYGAGWIAVILAGDWTTERAKLLSPEAYLAHIQRDAQEEIENS